MGSIWKVVLSFAVIIMITAVGITVTAANADVAAAGTYLEELSALIREGNYNDGMIRQCKKEAEENGYVLDVEVYRRQSYDRCSYARVRLQYPYRLPVFGIQVYKVKERIL